MDASQQVKNSHSYPRLNLPGKGSIKRAGEECIVGCQSSWSAIDRESASGLWCTRVGNVGVDTDWVGRK